ncbi:peptidylprolyl isomerase [Phenylobacterium sp. J367]|nr:peptidylprolyl isomerase [Phenylobacterium sp. J367]MCR5878939.1 peptidylprolyl isomerase [Phenylobacterium sp. J367]
MEVDGAAPPQSHHCMRSLLLIAAAALLSAQAPAPSDWRALDPENTLVVETSKGRIVVEMRPEFAPQSVARVKLLAREKVYDGLLFHRVIDGFVNQTGNPNNKDGGVSNHPDLPPEFTFKLKPGQGQVAVSRVDAQEGFVGATPFAAVSAAEAKRATDGTLRAWAPIATGWWAWAGRPIRAPATARSSSCGPRPAGSTGTTRSGAGSCRAGTWSAPSRSASRRPTRTEC